MPLKEVDWDKFQFRCHYLGELMTKPKGKSNLQKFEEAENKYIVLKNKYNTMKPGVTKHDTEIKLIRMDGEIKYLRAIKDVPNLSQTAKRRLAQIYTEETTGRVKDIESVYLEKGLRTEEDSITLYSLRYGIYYRKNRERVSNGYITGEIDFDDEKRDLVVDTKSTWDVFTFDVKQSTIIDPLYAWQGQGYMWLKGRKFFRLAYCLNDTPTDMIARMQNRMKYNFIGTEAEFREACDLLTEKHTYKDLPIARKIRVYDLERDEEKIEQLKTSIPHFRNYLKNFEDGQQQTEEETE